MSEVIKPANEKQLFGHPQGLFYLFFAELWERFSFLRNACIAHALHGKCNF